MTTFLRWWMSKPADFKYAFAGLLLPYVLMGLLFWLGKH